MRGWYSSEIVSYREPNPRPRIRVTFDWDKLRLRYPGLTDKGITKILEDAIDEANQSGAPALPAVQ